MYGSKLGKKYVKDVYCHPAYLSYIQITSWEMQDWMKYKLESRLQGGKKKKKIAGRNINDLRYADDTTLMAESKEESNSILMKVKEQSKKAGYGIWSHHFIANRWGSGWNSNRLYFLGLQSHWMVTAAMKLKDIWSLEENQWQT